jgi:hypothetical protein
MCVPNRLRDPRTRRLMVLGNFSLVAGVAMLNFMRHDFGQHPAAVQSWLDGLTGLFFGISIGANLMAVRCARMRSAAAPVQR